jgi:hypothetical protein
MSEKELAELPNLGAKSAKLLVAAGISSVAELREHGAVGAYLAIKREGLPVSLNMLFVIQGALKNELSNKLDRNERENLIMELDSRMEEEGL